MSCAPGKPCEEGKKRRIAIGVLGIMAIIFFVLSAFSFVSSRGQVTPETVTYGPYNAVQGRRVFQAWNCMDCHTIVGNGAYFAPDLTKEYKKVGPAWLAAFLPSAGGWPTKPAVEVHLRDAAQADASGTADMAAYLKQYPGAARRIEQRGGHGSYMPNLALSGADVDKLIAFLKYTSALDTEGWPPRPKVDGEALLAAKVATPAAVAPATPNATGAGAPEASTESPAALGAKLVTEYGCTSCHALDASKKVGPGWGGLAGSTVKLAGGGTLTADDAYLMQSILDPDAKIVAGFQKGVMPSFSGVLKQQQVDDIVAYLHTLKGDHP